jgi:hypothetical protein
MTHCLLARINFFRSFSLQPMASLGIVTLVEAVFVLQKVKNVLVEDY